MSCGHAEINDAVEESLGESYEGNYNSYIFIHQQDYDDVIQQMQTDTDKIRIHWCWSFFDSNEHSADDYNKLAKNIINVLSDEHVTFEYDPIKNIKIKLIMVVDRHYL